MAHIIQAQTVADTRGKLSIIEKILPFEVKRLYYIYDVPSPSIDRGGHRHQKTYQALICIKGTCEIVNNNGEKSESFFLNAPDQCLILEPRDFHTMKNFSSDAVLLVLASEYFDPEDYIDEAY